MTLIIGTLIIALVVFMVLAMALAEWADKDPGELWAAWAARRRGTPDLASAGTAPTAAKSEAPPTPVPRRARTVSARSGVTRGRKRTNR